MRRIGSGPPRSASRPEAEPENTACRPSPGCERPLFGREHPVDQNLAPAMGPRAREAVCAGPGLARRDWRVGEWRAFGVVSLCRVVWKHLPREISARASPDLLFFSAFSICPIRRRSCVAGLPMCRSLAAQVSAAQVSAAKIRAHVWHDHDLIAKVGPFFSQSGQIVRICRKRLILGQTRANFCLVGPNLAKHTANFGRVRAKVGPN